MNMHAQSVAESEAVTFPEVRKRLALYLRALWDRNPELHPFPSALEASRPYLTPLGIHLPASYRAVRGRNGVDLYRAATAHAVAHQVFSSRQPMPRGSLRPIQVVLVGMLEDARVELLACRELPGLRRLWLGFHEARAQGGVTTFADLAVRLARALLDPAFEDDNPWVAKGRALFLDPDRDLSDPALCRHLGSLLGNDIGQMRLQFNAKTWVIEPLYRDDNSHLWQPEEPEQGLTLEVEAMLVKPERTEADGGDPHDDPDGGEFERRLKPVPGELAQDKPQVAAEFLRSAKYPEWDYLIGAARAQWCTVQEVQPAPGDPSVIDAILARNEDLLDHLDRLVRAKQLRKPVRLRKQMDGDRFDLDAAVTAMLDMRSRRTPDARFHERIDHRVRDLSVLVLLDLSHSANEPVRGGNASVLQLTREATVLLAHTMEKIGDQFAIHGFCSNGRNEVRYRRFKDFARPFDEEVKGRLAGMDAELSTRMGGAIRHATGWLKPRQSERKLILLITDGEPHDIDVHDSRYLMFDAKKAVDEAARAGILTYCMSVDPEADRYVARIFGARNYMVVDHIRRLPEKLPMLYLRLTH